MIHIVYIKLIYCSNSGFKILQRHNIINPAIGAFDEEVEAVDIVQRSFWALPLFVLLSSLLDMMMMWVFLTFLHPWKEILEVS